MLFECDKCGQVHTSDELRIRIDGMSGWDDFLCVKCFEEDELPTIKELKN